MNDAGKQHKRAWEYDAYNFWVKHNGTPEVRAKEDVENPTKMLRKYASYFDHYEGVKIANICGSCGKKAIPLSNFKFNFSSVSGERRFHLFQKPFCNRCKALILIPD